MAEATFGDLRLIFVELGEGLCENYNPNDPDDVELLRVDLYINRFPYDPDEAVYSYCTMCHADLTESERQTILDRWVKQLDQHDPKYQFQHLTWEENRHNTEPVQKCNCK